MLINNCYVYPEGNRIEQLFEARNQEADNYKSAKWKVGNKICALIAMLSGIGFYNFLRTHKINATSTGGKLGALSGSDWICSALPQD